MVILTNEDCKIVKVFVGCLNAIKYNSTSAKKVKCKTKMISYLHMSLEYLDVECEEILFDP